VGLLAFEILVATILLAIVSLHLWLSYRTWKNRVFSEGLLKIAGLSLAVAALYFLVAGCTVFLFVLSSKPSMEAFPFVFWVAFLVVRNTRRF
jgi:hypothetical protein